MPHRRITIALLFISVFALGSWAQNPSQGGKHQVGYQSIDDKAALVKVDDAKSVRALADEVFSMPRVFPRMPSLIENRVKDRLVQAEILYRQGKKPGVREEDVVLTLNDLAEQFGAPPHARTALSQLRTLRMWLALSQPKFMGEGIAHANAAQGESMSPMSPLQAAHLISTLMDQKLINPDFQVTPQEWDDVTHQKVTEEIQAQHSRAVEAQATGRTTATLNVRTFSSEPRRQIENTVYPYISSLSVADGLNLLDQVFTKLRIE